MMLSLYRRLLAALVLMALVLTACSTGSSPPRWTGEPEGNSCNPQPAPRASGQVALTVTFTGPRDWRLRAALRNPTEQAVTDLEIRICVRDKQGVVVPALLQTYGAYRPYVLLPGEALPFYVVTRAKPGDVVALSAAGTPTDRRPLDLRFVPDPRADSPVLGRLENHDRRIRGYEVSSTTVEIVPLDGSGFPLGGQDERGYIVSLGRTPQELSLQGDWAPGESMLVSDRSDWAAARKAIAHGRYKVVITNYRGVPDFVASPDGELLTEAEARYIARLGPAKAEAEQMAYQAYLDQCKPPHPPQVPAHPTALVYVFTVKGEGRTPWGAVFNRWQVVIDARTGYMLDNRTYWDSAEGPPPS